MNTISYWSESASLPRFAKISKDCKVDVAVVGAGITGVTAAYLLKKSGHSVALIERGRVGGFDTANTTAHLTCVTDIRLHELVHRLGKPAARAVWDAGRAAIYQIHRNIQTESIACEFKWIPGYLHAPLGSKSNEDRALFQEDARISNELGFSAQFLDSVPALDRCGVRFQHQAKFHPLKYLGALLRTLPGKGSHVFEHTETTEVQEKPLVVKAGKSKISCSYVVIATHTPLMGKTSLVSATLSQSKLFLYMSYAVGARIPRDIVPEASFWDTGNPYYYLRIDKRRGSDYAIFGGEDHKTGQEENTANRYQSLEKRLLELIPGSKVMNRWSGQVIATPDGLPYIGETADRQFVGTGFAGNGMTFGTLTAMMAVDAMEKRKNPWKELFNVERKKVLSGAWEYVLENKDYPYYLLRDWLGPAEGSSLRALRRNSGKVLSINGQKTAAYRDPAGKVSLCSPVCTHLKCIVRWNDAEKTWDCPCHGSRFAATGEVLSGPAEERLEKLDKIPK